MHYSIAPNFPQAISEGGKIKPFGCWLSPLMLDFSLCQLPKHFYIKNLRIIQVGMLYGE